jgi:2-oxo-4-hydroxy-4-carboxy-5-ureidoimidazoline decarboxylase
VSRVRLSELNGRTLAGFVEVCGPLFEGSPWVAERAWALRPFACLEELHRALAAAAEDATLPERLSLIRAHPDLVGRMARQAALGADSRAEQEAAGLDALTAEEISLFDSFNRAYREKFGFPFVICARESRKKAILAAFPQRLARTRGEEIEAALREIAAIARLRLLARVEEG